MKDISKDSDYSCFRDTGRKVNYVRKSHRVKNKNTFIERDIFYKVYTFSIKKYMPVLCHKGHHSLSSPCKESFA